MQPTKRAHVFWTMIRSIDDIEDEGLYEIKDLIRVFKASETSIRRFFRNEPGVLRMVTPGRTRTQLRIPGPVVKRVWKRWTVPERPKPRV